jgi:hypothetical protein
MLREKHWGDEQDDCKNQAGKPHKAPQTNRNRHCRLTPIRLGVYPKDSAKSGKGA